MRANATDTTGEIHLHAHRRTARTRMRARVQHKPIYISNIIPPNPYMVFSCVSLGVMQQRYLLSRGRTAGLQQTPPILFLHFRPSILW